MRRVQRTAKFRADLKRILSGIDRKAGEEILPNIVYSLACDQLMVPRLRDHALTGNWKGHRECHIKPDLLLIYRKPNSEILVLVRLGSHSELF